MVLLCIGEWNEAEKRASALVHNQTFFIHGSNLHTPLVAVAFCQLLSTIAIRSSHNADLKLLYSNIIISRVHSLFIIATMCHSITNITILDQYLLFHVNNF